MGRRVANFAPHFFILAQGLLNLFRHTCWARIQDQNPEGLTESMFWSVAPASV